VGILPEGEFFSRAPGISPYELGQNEAKYPFERIFATAELASQLKPEALTELIQALGDDDGAVRYWAALGILMRGKAGFDGAGTAMRSALVDISPYVRIVAAQTLGMYGTADDVSHALSLLVEMSDSMKHEVFVAIAALTALGSLGDKTKSVAEAIQVLPANGKLPDARYSPYVPQLLQDLQSRLR
jgi:uncharacterized sulfatase